MDVIALVPFLLIFVIFYFLIFRPQATRQKMHAQMLSELKTGQNVLLSNGIFGKISKISEEEMVIEIAPDVKIRVLKNIVSKVV